MDSQVTQPEPMQVDAANLIAVRDIPNIGTITVDLLASVPTEYQSVYMKTSPWDFLIQPLADLQPGEPAIRIRSRDKRAAQHTAERARVKIAKLKLTRSANGPVFVKTWNQPVDQSNPARSEWYTFLQKVENHPNRATG